MGKFAIERHKYAPELNRAIVKRGGVWHWIKAPGVQSVREYRQKNAPAAPGILARVSTHYEAPEYKNLERVYTGRVESRADALRFARAIREKEKGGALITGGYLPAARVCVKTRIVG